SPRVPAARPAHLSTSASLHPNQCLPYPVPLPAARTQPIGVAPGPAPPPTGDRRRRPDPTATAATSAAPGGTSNAARYPASASPAASDTAMLITAAAATPRAAPNWNEVFTSPPARPCSDSVTPSVARIVVGPYTRAKAREINSMAGIMVR